MLATMHPACSFKRVRVNGRVIIAYQRNIHYHSGIEKAAENWLAQININEEVHTSVMDMDVRLDEAVVSLVVLHP